MSDPLPHLTYDEVATVLEFIQGCDVVLVGGQSLAMWSRHYRQKKPELVTLYSMTSEDVDFFGDKEAAAKFAEKLANSAIYVPGPDDHTPHAAVVEGTVANRTIRIDFMKSLLGVDDVSIERNFVTLTGVHRTTHAPIEILVLHPLDCLRSRLANINDLRRFDAHSLSSAKAAVVVLDSFIDDMLSTGNIKEAQTILHDLEYVMRDGCVRKPAFKEFGIDARQILRKYSEDARLDGRLRELRLKRAIARLDTRFAAHVR